MPISITHGKAQTKNVIYYVTVRCHRKARLIARDADLQKYASILECVKERRGFLLHDYVIMPDHIHLVIGIMNNTRIEDIIHDINRQYACWYNEHYNWKGKFWEERHYGDLISDELQLLAAMHSIDLNPVRSGLCDYPAEWKYSGARFYLNNTPDNLIDAPECLERLSAYKLSTT